MWLLSLHDVRFGTSPPHPSDDVPASERGADDQGAPTTPVGDAAKRSYHQPDCGLAVALDLLGERWTLLILRELLLGPQRYTDVLGALDGLSTNLLATRLRHLERTGLVVRSELPPPAASTVYELTPLGRDLEPTLLQLARWGTHFTAPHGGHGSFDSRTAAFALLAHLERIPAEPGSATYQFEVGDHALAVEFATGDRRVVPHRVGSPDVVIGLSADLYWQMLCGDVDLAGEVAAGRARVHGDPDQVTTAILWLNAATGTDAAGGERP